MYKNKNRQKFGGKKQKMLIIQFMVEVFGF